MKHALLFRVSFGCLVVTLTGCYAATSLRLPVRSPNAPLGCVGLADQVFFGAGYVKISGSNGALVYTPRGPALTRSSMPLTWGIGVWKPKEATWTDGPGACEYELQAVSADPNCSIIQCPLTPQPGAQYDQATREMAERLRSAGAATASTAGAVPATLE